MKYFFKILLFFLLVSLVGCSGKKEKEVVVDSIDLESQMIEAYNAGIKALEEGDILFAAKNFNTVENIYPQSIWAPRSILMAAYSYYSQNYYGDAISEIERFLKKYPKNDDYAYAYFLIATCYYELIVDEKKDISPIIKSKEYFNIVIEKYPETDFALDAKFKLDLIKEILASKEMYLGNYYIQKKKWIPAINRYKNIINEYETTIYIEEALHRLVELHYKIGLENEAKKYAQLLGYNYLSSDWYKNTYKIFNNDYKLAKPKTRKKESSYLIKKYNSIFKRK